MGEDRVVLFVCEHGAAKSVLAAELLERRVIELNLPIIVRSAGIEPSDAVIDNVVALIPERARELRTSPPRRITRDDIEAASITVGFGVDDAALPAQPSRLLRWEDVPPVSEEPVAARAAIERHIDDLVEELRT